MYCICCKKNNVTPEDGWSKKGDKEKREEEDILWKRSKRPDGSLVNVNNEMIDNGIIHIIHAGYGSIHDGDQIVIAICDDCIKLYQNLLIRKIFYFILYLCTLEIAPYYFIYNWFTKN